MAYQYRFVDILARGLENAANRADRAEAARVQQKQFEATERRARDEFNALQKIRESAEKRAKETAEDEQRYRKLNYELQVDRAIMDMVQFDTEQDNAMERLGMQLDNALKIAQIGSASETEMIDVATLPPALREMLNLPEGVTTVSSKVLPVYNTALAGINKIGGVNPDSLTELDDASLASLKSFNQSMLEMTPDTALVFGVKPGDLATIGKNLQVVEAELNRRAEKTRKAREAAEQEERAKTDVYRSSVQDTLRSAPGSGATIY